MKVAADAVAHLSKVCVDWLERAIILHAPKAPQFCLSALLGMARIMHFVLFSSIHLGASGEQEIICHDVNVFPLTREKCDTLRCHF